MKSMTGFAARTGAGLGFGWTMDIRGVNGKGLSLRTRVPDWIDGLDQAVRAAVTAEVPRGSVQISMRVTRDEGGSGFTLDKGGLDAALSALAQVQDAALEAGLDVVAPSAAEVLSLRGVIPTEGEVPEGLLQAIMADVKALLADFQGMRAQEGAQLKDTMTRALAEIAALTDASATALEARRDAQAEGLRSALKRVAQEVSVDEARLAQELALIAVRSDVTEEVDRLRAHLDAAHALLGQDGPIGRKFDFLSQEFNREANTLCSKAQFAELTSIGLDLKVVIDQLREQIQNVE